MRVVFLEDVEGVAQGGDVKEVKNGFARNFLIPKNLAVPATHNALQRIESLSKESETTRIKTMSTMRELGEALEGMQINVEMRSGVGGRLYGSVTNTIIAEQLSELTDREIDRRTINLDEPIRELGMYDLSVRLHADVTANIKVLVYPVGTDPMAGEDEDGADVESEEDSEGTTDETVVAEVAEASADDDLAAEPVVAEAADDATDDEDSDAEESSDDDEDSDAEESSDDDEDSDTEESSDDDEDSDAESADEERKE